MKKSHIIIGLAAVAAVAASFWLMNRSESQADLAVSAERQQQCEEFLTVALFPDDGSADRFLEACLRGEPVLPGEAEEEALP